MEIYLTKMVLNTHSRRVWNDLGNPQQLHKTVSGGFPAIDNAPGLKEHEKKKPRGEYNILHRLETNKSSGKPVLLIQSTAEPDWSNLAAGYAEEIFFKRLRDRYTRIEAGMDLRFRLQANPTKRIGQSYEHPDENSRIEFTAKFRDEKKRRRIMVNSDAQRLEWLERKALDNGFRIGRVELQPGVPNIASSKNGALNFRKGNGLQKITFGSVVFDGVLQVTDVEKFQAALIKGIGTGKAYGFGLLSIAAPFVS